MNDSPRIRISLSAVREQTDCWPPDDAPEAKARNQGMHALTDAEVLSLLLPANIEVVDEEGISLYTALDVARYLLRTRGLASFRDVHAADHLDVLDEDAHLRIEAAIELGRRVQAVPTDRVQVSTPSAVAGVYAPLMRDLRREVFRVVFLTTANTILGDEVVSEGGIASAIIDPRMVFEPAIRKNAASVICLHNHPSGNPEPSREDIRVTRQIAEAGKILGIPLYDHIIIAGPTHTSLAERGIVP